MLHVVPSDFLLEVVQVSLCVCMCCWVECAAAALTAVGGGIIVLQPHFNFLLVGGERVNQLVCTLVLNPLMGSVVVVVV